MKNSKKVTITLFIIFTAMIIASRIYLHEWLQIDVCLDSGGKYNKTTKVCEK